MKVGKLKQLLELLPDDTEVVVPAFDHSYRKAGAYTEKARRTPVGIDEHYEEIPVENGEEVIDVLLIN